MAKDMLFATLDPTMRGIKLPNGQQAILSDTVGFIRNLPTELVAAFGATLEEVVEADIILHVHDVAGDDVQGQHETVNETLKNLGIETDSDHIIHAYNKIDLLKEKDLFEYNRLTQSTRKDASCSTVSAITGEGMNDLLNKIVYHLNIGQTDYRFNIPAKDGKAIAWLHANATVKLCDYSEDNAAIIAMMGEAAYQKFIKVFHYPAS
jgi:GTP-binding protein HflX